MLQPQNGITKRCCGCVAALALASRTQHAAECCLTQARSACACACGSVTACTWAGLAWVAKLCMCLVKSACAWSDLLVWSPILYVMMQCCRSACGRRTGSCDQFMWWHTMNHTQRSSTSLLVRGSKLCQSSMRTRTCLLYVGSCMARPYRHATEFAVHCARCSMVHCLHAPGMLMSGVLTVPNWDQCSFEY